MRNGVERYLMIFVNAWNNPKSPSYCDALEKKGGEILKP
jgi:hypothetical protein